MPVLDLRDYIVFKYGTWWNADALEQKSRGAFSLADTLTADRLMLRWPGDMVTLAGPLRVRVTLQSENVTYAAGADPTISADSAASDRMYKEYMRLKMPVTASSGSSSAPSAPSSGDERSIETSEAIHRSHELEIAAGGAKLQMATMYSYLLEIPPGQTWPFTFREGAVMRQLGTNAGYRVLIEHPFVDQALCVTQPTNDLPCDFAVANIPDASKFFPAACEPCEGSVSIGLPPGATTLAIPVADGGCVRPRFFNGMFITREDLEAEQRYFRMKHRLHNRASGEGVVWGLNVGKQGAQVCVLPGYAVDCCGNDLTVTSIYKVDIATLLRDPAAAQALAGHTPKRMHLLLEYVECPSDPRPVHADPCGGSARRCEMSRIRESVRLRLVPPRDVALAGPLQTFLDRVKRLRRAQQSQRTRDVESSPLRRVPFQLQLTMTVSSAATGGTPAATRTKQVVLRPTPDKPQSIESLADGDSAVTGVEIAILPDASVVFAGGRLDVVKDHKAVADPIDFNGASLDFAPPKVPVSATAGDGVYTYGLSAWAAESLLAPEDSPRLRGTTKLTLIFRNGSVWKVVLDQSPLEMAPTERAPDCAREACQTDDEDPVLPVLPWLHTDPLHARNAGDPKALILAALQGWLMQTMLRDRAGTPSEAWSARRRLATAIYEGAWLLFYGIDTNDTEAQPTVLESLRQLFRSWCEDFLYKGPECRGEPHGAVIGCTTVRAGAMGDIDPFGGRRWVIHHPLIAHWMGAFGLAPLDVTASRMFSTICCIASLATPGRLPQRQRAWVTNLGGGYLTFGTASDVAARMKEVGLEITQAQTVGAGEFIRTFIQAMKGSSSSTSSANALRVSVGDPFAPDVLSIVTATSSMDLSFNPDHVFDHLPTTPGGSGNP